MIRIGIVGVGYNIGIANFHFKAFKRLEDVEITAVCDLKKENAEEYIARYELPNAKATDNFDEFLELVDAVVISTQNNTHVDLTIKALEAGKHVLCEKPFGVNEEDCKKALEIAEKSDRVSMIGLCYRNIPAYRYLKYLSDSGELGEVFFIRMCQTAPRIGSPLVKLEWRLQRNTSGSGALGDFGSHIVDLIDWIFSERCGHFTEGQAMLKTVIKERKREDNGESAPVENDDVAMFNMRLGDTPVEILTSRIGGPGNFMEIYASKANVIYSGAEAFSLQIQKRDEATGVAGAYERVEVPEEFYTPDPTAPRVNFEINFYGQAYEFIDCIKNNKKPGTDLKRGAYIQHLIDTLERSAKEGKNLEF